jgi:hypothetical protein
LTNDLRYIRKQTKLPFLLISRKIMSYLSIDAHLFCWVSMDSMICFPLLSSIPINWTRRLIKCKISYLIEKDIIRTIIDRIYLRLICTNSMYCSCSCVSSLLLIASVLMKNGERKCDGLTVRLLFGVNNGTVPTAGIKSIEKISDEISWKLSYQYDNS